jgi:hypothetical protein
MNKSNWRIVGNKEIDWLEFERQVTKMSPNSGFIGSLPPPKMTADDKTVVGEADIGRHVDSRGDKKYATLGNRIMLR